jgi:hypothetical protein
MFCKHCGKELNEGAKFCATCGTPTRGAGNAVPVSKEFRFLKTWIYSSIALVILMTIFFGLSGSFEKGFLEPFVGVIMLAGFFGVLVTFGIKWRKKGFVFDKTSASNLSSKEAAKLRGIGGWLILVIIGLFFTIGSQLYTVYTDAQLFANGTVAFLSDPTSKVYIPAYGGFLKFELIMSIILSVAAIYLAYLFFRKDSKFPKYYVLFLIATPVYLLLDYGLLCLMTVPVEAKKVIEDAMSEQPRAIGGAFIGALIWGSYMVKSKRVKATFTN